MKNWPSSLIVAVSVLTLAAGSCRNTTNSAPRMPANAEPSTDAGPRIPSAKDSGDLPVIVAFGDSLTAGVSGVSYPERLQELLDAAGEKYRVENQGVSGDTTTDGLARIENVMAAHPFIVLLEFGGNDGLRGLPVSTTKSNLTEMIDQLKAKRIQIVLLGITLPPNYGPDYVQPFTAIFPALAKHYDLPVFPFLLAHVYQDANLMQPDGIHPNDAGNRIVARDVFQILQPILKANEAKKRPG